MQHVKRTKPFFGPLTFDQFKQKHYQDYVKRKKMFDADEQARAEAYLAKNFVNSVPKFKKGKVAKLPTIKKFKKYKGPRQSRTVRRGGFVFG